MVALVMVCVVFVIIKLIISIYKKENRYGECFFQLFICSILFWLCYGLVGGGATVINAYREENIKKFRITCDTSIVKTDSIIRELSATDYEMLQKIENSGGTKYEFHQYYFKGTYTESNEFTWPLKTSYRFDPSIKHWELVLPK